MNRRTLADVSGRKVYSMHRLSSGISGCGQLCRGNLWGHDPGGTLTQPFYMHREFAAGWLSRISLGLYLLRISVMHIVKGGQEDRHTIVY